MYNKICFLLLVMLRFNTFFVVVLIPLALFIVQKCLFCISLCACVQKSESSIRRIKCGDMHDCIGAQLFMHVHT